MAADISAFRALMRHLKAADPQHTVLMVQVEDVRIWNGDQTDSGLNLTKVAQVLRVKLMTF